MEKYLFTDGTNGVREVQSDDALQNLIRSAADPLVIRIWVFSTSEWISYAEFNKRFVNKNPVPLKPVAGKPVPARPKTGLRHPDKWLLLGRLSILAIVLLIAFFVYNFTRVHWINVPPVQTTAARPQNVPPVNIDSLISMIEYDRGQKLDKMTATNLRIRNNWPDQVQLQLNADRDSSLAGSRFYNVAISIDNATGYQIDNAVVLLRCWKAGETSSTDTLHFDGVSYIMPVSRRVTTEFRGDSLSVSFLSIRAKSFNFCYAAGKESNYGNLNDRWFCRD